MSAIAENGHADRGTRTRKARVLLVAACGLAVLVPAMGRAAQTCPAPTAVPPLGTCHPSACTPGFCTRGDIAPLSAEADAATTGPAGAARLQPP